MLTPRPRNCAKKSRWRAGEKWCLELEGERGRGCPGLAQTEPVKGSPTCLLDYGNVGLRYGNTNGEVNRRSQLSPCAMHAAAFLADLCLSGEMKMERQEEDKKQERQGDQARRAASILPARLKHDVKASQGASACQ